ncbi:MAG: twin-arginine translocation signal domain-containing protein [Proteobacteria bacterium]|nr:twin-arginine translocation signal domain-containing protein [Pseudomonadota bacterium]
MNISRRNFLKVSSSSAVALALGCGKEQTPGEKLSATPAWVDTRDPKYGRETTTLCAYCAGGCGNIVTTALVEGENKVVNIEGDPDHPINQGALCSKAQSLYQVANNERRMKKVLYRAPGASDWTEISWEDALNGIADKIKATRDATFETTVTEGTSLNTVNRTRGIAFIGGSGNENEEGYLYTKLARSLGVVYLETQARI